MKLKFDVGACYIIFVCFVGEKNLIAISSDPLFQEFMRIDTIYLDQNNELHSELGNRAGSILKRSGRPKKL